MHRSPFSTPSATPSSPLQTSELRHKRTQDRFQARQTATDRRDTLSSHQHQGQEHGRGRVPAGTTTTTWLQHDSLQQQQRRQGHGRGPVPVGRGTLRSPGDATQHHCTGHGTAAGQKPSPDGGRGGGRGRLLQEPPRKAPLQQGSLRQ